MRQTLHFLHNEKSFPDTFHSPAASLPLQFFTVLLHLRCKLSYTLKFHLKKNSKWDRRSLSLRDTVYTHSAKHHTAASTAKINCKFGRISVHTREHKEEEEEGIESFLPSLPFQLSWGPSSQASDQRLHIWAFPPFALISCLSLFQNSPAKAQFNKERWTRKA